MKILLLKDDETIAQFIVNGLKQAGFTIDQTTDGKEGLHLAFCNSYDLGIFDIMLPSLEVCIMVAMIT